MKLPYQPDFSGKVAVVTGGAGVLCAMFARVLAQCGARVAVLDLTLDKAEALSAEIRLAGGEAIAVGVNVLEQES
ncbi:MAG: SDR family NAD(P)-dependent oxidoreductase, partial [Bacillota bacterium]